MHSENLDPERNAPSMPTHSRQNPAEDISDADSGDAAFRVDYSAIKRMDWSTNKHNWKRYVNIKEIDNEDLLTSCDMLSQLFQ